MEPSQSGQTLRARVRAGDPDAFDELFDEHASAVYNQGYRLTLNWSSAEEVVSLTFLEAWRLRAGVEEAGGSLRPWLLGISLNVVRNLNRAARRYQAAMSRIPRVRPVPDFADDLAGRLDDAAELRRVLAALDGLRPGERDVIVLCVWSGLDYAAAAKALGVPIGTVRSRLSRARDKLKRTGTSGGSGGSSLRANTAREPATGSGQQVGDRKAAVRSVREVTR
jgi:RNA polymerase sigma-70 factor, ECF subfamily